MPKDMFGEEICPVPTDIPGLLYRKDVIDYKAELWLINHIDQYEWNTDLKRRTQQYGYKYNYTKKTSDDYIGELPTWLTRLATKIELPFVPEQVIINEYQPGQGIAQHVDCWSCYGRAVASLSLGSACVMPMFDRVRQKNKAPDAERRIWLERRSLLVLDAQSRITWTHGINPVKSDIINGHKFDRERRISITFRSMRHSDKE